MDSKYRAQSLVECRAVHDRKPAICSAMYLSNPCSPEPYLQGWNPQSRSEKLEMRTMWIRGTSEKVCNHKHDGVTMKDVHEHWRESDHKTDREHPSNLNPERLFACRGFGSLYGKWLPQLKVYHIWYIWCWLSSSVDCFEYQALVPIVAYISRTTWRVQNCVIVRKSWYTRHSGYLSATCGVASSSLDALSCYLAARTHMPV